MSHAVGCLPSAVTLLFGYTLETGLLGNTILALVLGRRPTMNTSWLAPQHVPVASSITSLPVAIGDSGKHPLSFIIYCLVSRLQVDYLYCLVSPSLICELTVFVRLFSMLVSSVSLVSIVLFI